jgi:hypothetical protein
MLPTVMIGHRAKSEGRGFVLVVEWGGLAVPEVGGAAGAFDPLEPAGEVLGKATFRGLDV